MSVIEVSDDLLKEAKNFLDQTWDDEASDEKLIGSLRRGIAYITAKTGVEASVFSSDSGDGRAQNLLFNYLLYDRAGAVDTFVRNYTFEINSLRRRSQVAAKQAEEKEAADATETTG